MDKDMLEMFGTVIDKIDSMDKKFNAMDKRLDGIDTRLDAMDKKFDAIDLRIDTEVRGLKILIENDVSKKIDSLFDGYMLVHEKQHISDESVKQLEVRVERLETLQHVG